LWRAEDELRKVKTGYTAKRRPHVGGDEKMVDLEKNGLFV